MLTNIILERATNKVRSRQEACWMDFVTRKVSSGQNVLRQ